MSTNVSSFANFYIRKNQSSRVLVSPELDPVWYEEVRERLNQLNSLEKGWNGYEAVPVSFENALFALSMLDKICSIDTQPPQIVPGTSGDLSIEWHTLRGDLELHVKEPNHVEAYYSNLNDNIEEERTIKIDFTDVVEWVKNVTESSFVETAFGN